MHQDLQKLVAWQTPLRWVALVRDLEVHPESGSAQAQSNIPHPETRMRLAPLGSV